MAEDQRRPVSVEELAVLHRQVLETLATIEGAMERAGGGGRSTSQAAATLAYERGRRIALRALGKIDPSPIDRASEDPDDEWKTDWMSLEKACSTRILMRSDRDTVRRLVIDHGLGEQRNGRWQVDGNRARAFMDREPYPRLNPYPQRG